MENDKILQGKKVLIVDDEEDVLDTLTEILSICMIDRATTFQKAKYLLEKIQYDAIILDIMGVHGFELLKIARKRNIPSIMLTSHALTKDSLIKSAEEGASFYVPKEKMGEIDVFISDVLEAKQKNKNPWIKWYERIGAYFENRKEFKGYNWRENQKKYYEEKLKKMGNV